MRVLLSLAAHVLARVYRAYFATLRVRARLPDGALIEPHEYPFGPEIFAICERDALVLAGITAGRDFHVLVARGRDGDWATAALQAVGCRVVRGATRRGGATALLALIHELRKSASPLGLVVDGPLGPAGRANGGAVICSLKTRRPLRALGAAAQHQIVFSRTWSRIFLPLPFSRVAIALEHVEMPGGADQADVARLTDALSAGLARTREAALQALRRT